MKTLRKIDFSTVTDFECGGKHFYIMSDTLGFIRFKKSQEIMTEFGYSSSFIEINKNLDTAIEFFNKGKNYEMAITIYKIREGIKNITEKDDPSLRLCALFINEKDEDISRYDESLMKAKINCWAEELSVAPFFYLAASLVEGWTNAYEKVIQHGLKVELEK